MKKIMVILLFGSVFLLTNKNNNVLNITEEATPIRNNITIEAMDYRITINNNSKDRIIKDTQIIDSINHYLNVSERNNFMINLKLINNSHDKYYLKRIVIYNNVGIIKTYNYNKQIDYTEINLNLDKKLLKKVIKNSKVTGKIKIIIEK
ncbi:MAG: hypothetical protein IJG97_02110 [Bacilli bacterium]|nr:hypothetical protein [Bacilli bacterium]